MKKGFIERKEKKGISDWSGGGNDMGVGNEGKFGYQ